MKKAQIKIDRPFIGPKRKWLAVGDVVRVDVDSHGTPLERFWRDRLKEAKTDGCCHVVEAKKPAPAKTATTKGGE